MMWHSTGEDITGEVGCDNDGQHQVLWVEGALIKLGTNISIVIGQSQIFVLAYQIIRISEMKLIKNKKMKDLK